MPRSFLVKKKTERKVDKTTNLMQEPHICHSEDLLTEERREVLPLTPLNRTILKDTDMYNFNHDKFPSPKEQHPLSTSYNAPAKELHSSYYHIQNYYDRLLKMDFAALPPLLPIAGLPPVVPKAALSTSEGHAIPSLYPSIRPYSQHTLPTHYPMASEYYRDFLPPYPWYLHSLMSQTPTPHATPMPNLPSPPPEKDIMLKQEHHPIKAENEDIELDEEHIDVEEIDEACSIDAEVLKLNSNVDERMLHSPIDYSSKYSNDQKPTEPHSIQGAPLSPAASFTSEESSLSKRAKGFQDGVTVGYTYEAFFISDGRSRKKGQLFTDTKQRYTCNVCGKDYATSSNLSRHKQTHRNPDSDHAKRCPHCSKVYVSMPALSMHILTHNLKHKCNQCGKSFSRPWLLHGHLRSHTGEKPYGCAHCGKAFADRSNLRAHMQTHSAFKQFKCKRCNKCFALKSYLNKHYESACVKDEGMCFPDDVSEVSSISE